MNDDFDGLPQIHLHLVQIIPATSRWMVRTCEDGKEVEEESVICWVLCEHIVHNLPAEHVPNPPFRSVLPMVSAGEAGIRLVDDYIVDIYEWGSE